MKASKVTILGVALLVIIGLMLFFSADKHNSTDKKQIQIADVQKKDDKGLTNFLIAVINYAHEGYQADQATLGVDSSDITGLMAAMIEQIDDEKQAVSFIAPYASSTDESISKGATLLAASEADVATKQQAALDVLRQITNGDSSTNVQYTIAQVKASQDERNNNVILVTTLIPYLTMNISTIASSTDTVGPLDPTSALTDDEKSELKTNLQMDFGGSLTSNQNDIFLILAQEINLLLNSRTYADFHKTWLNSITSIPSSSAGQ